MNLGLPGKRAEQQGSSVDEAIDSFVNGSNNRVDAGPAATYLTGRPVR